MVRTDDMHTVRADDVCIPFARIVISSHAYHLSSPPAPKIDSHCLH